jgi:hypothetical protein
MFNVSTKHNEGKHTYISYVLIFLVGDKKRISDMASPAASTDISSIGPRPCTTVSVVNEWNVAVWLELLSSYLLVQCAYSS